MVQKLEVVVEIVSCAGEVSMDIYSKLKNIHRGSRYVL